MLCSLIFCVLYVTTCVLLAIINYIIHTFRFCLGEYDMKFDSASRTLVGFKTGEPANWRKATFLRPLTDSAASGSCDHEHAHNHNHGESCGHHH